MSEETGEKTELPTEKRLRDARSEGQIPARKNIVESTLIVVGTVIFMNSFYLLKNQNDKIFDTIFHLIDTTGTQDPRKYENIINQITEIFVFMLFISIFSAFVTFLFALYLNKFNFSIKSLTPKFEKLNPVNGFKGMFSKDTINNLARNILYFTIISSTCYYLTKKYIPPIVEAYSCGLHCIFDVFIEVFLLFILIILAMHIVLALIDFKVQNALFLSKNMMTKDAVKREIKQEFGDPHIVGQRNEITRSDAVLPGMSALTHVVYSSKTLICIQYDDEIRLPPFVLIKASGDDVPSIIRQIKASAKRGVHFVNMPDVANALYALGQSGEYIVKGSAPHLIKLLKATGQR